MKKITSLLLIILLLSMLVFSGCGKEYIEGTKLRCDGVYELANKGDNSYIKFFEEGYAKVLSEDSIKTPEEAVEEFTNGSIKAIQSVTFKTASGVVIKKQNGKETVAKQPDVEFSIKVNTGTTTYIGYVKGNKIKFKINNTLFGDSKKTYKFVQVD